MFVGHEAFKISIGNESLEIRVGTFQFLETLGEITRI